MNKLTQLIILAMVAAASFLGIGAWIVVARKSVALLSPNGLLRLTDTALLFAIALMLLTITLKKKE